MHECLHCRKRAVAWDADFGFEDYGLDGEGIVQVYHCKHCGARIQCFIRIDEDDIKELIEKGE